MLSRASHVPGHSLWSIALSSSASSHGRSSAFRLCLNSLPIPFLSRSSSSSSSPPQHLQFQSFSSPSSVSSSSFFSTTSVAHPASFLRGYGIPSSSIGFPSLSGSFSSAPTMGPPSFSAKASFTTGSSSGSGREILVQHLLVKENDLKLLIELQKRIAQGEDLSDLAVEYSVCPSKEEGGMLGWVKRGQMVPEFEEAAFSAPLNAVVRCKTKFGRHLLQVLSERDELLLQEIQAKELHEKLQDPEFVEQAQLIDVREPHEVFFHSNAVDAHIVSLCGSPSSVPSAVSLFENAIGSETPPSSKTCNFLVNELRKLGQHELAFSVYKKMTRVGVTPLFFSLAVLVEYFVHSQRPTHALGVVGLILKHGFDVNVYLVNLILKGLCQNGEVDEAMHLLCQMRRSSISPDVVSYNTVVNGLCRAKKLADALSLMDEMKKFGCWPDVKSYTALLDGLCKGGKVEDAMELMEEMKNNGFNVDVVAYSALISGFCNMGNADKGRELFYEMLQLGLTPNVITYSSLVQGLSKTGRWEEATAVLNEMAEKGVYPDVFTYTSLIDGLCKDGKISKAIHLLKLMLERGEEPNSVTYNSLINGFCREGLAADSFDILKLMMDKGRNPNVVTYSTLLKGLCETGKIDDALTVFSSVFDDEGYIQPDIMTYNTMIQGLCEEGRVGEAVTFYGKMVAAGHSGNLFTYNTLIGAYLKEGNIAKCMEHWKNIIDFGMLPGPHTYSIMIDGFCKLRMINIAKGLFMKLKAFGYCPIVMDYNSLMSALCKEGSIEQGRRLFEEMKQKQCEPDIISFNIMIDGAFKAGNFEYAKSLLTDMLQKGLVPDVVSFSTLIHGFTNNGQMDEAKNIFRRMVASGFSPTGSVYNSLLRGYCEKGEMGEVIDLLHQMAAENVVLSPEIKATILESLCSSTDLDMVDLLPTFSQDAPKEVVIPCKDFLEELQKFHSRYVVVYFSILYIRHHAGIVTQEMLSLPQAPYLAVGFLEALAGVSGMAATTMLSGESIPILSQTFLVWQILLSIVFLRRRYNVNHIIGCLLVSLGVIITVASGPSAGTSSKDVGIFWSLLMIFSFFLQAADTILKEVIFLDAAERLKGKSVDLFVVNSFGSAYQALFIGLLLPFLSKLWGIPFSQLPSYLKDGAACFLNVNSLPSGCDGAPLLPVLFVIVNMCYNVSLLYLLKISSALVTCLASTVTVPLSVFVFTMPLPYLGAGTSLPPGFLAGLVILVLGLLSYAWRPAMVPASATT